MQSESYDIAIAGGGLVGATLACALAPLGFRVAVVEAVSPRAELQPSYDDRTLALSHASCRILEGLGLWTGLSAEATAINEVVVTELGKPGRVCLHPGELGLHSFGHVIEARSFGAELVRHLQALQGVDLVCPARVTGVVVNESQALLRVDSKNGAKEIEASLLVAADGAASSIRGMLGIESSGKDYGQTAVICNITPEKTHQGSAFERMTPTGPFAILPHRGSRCGLVWCVASKDTKALLDLPEEEFLRQAQVRSGGVLGKFLQMGKRSSYPLKLVVANDDICRRALVMGNAAHAIHPAAAQGFNLGLRDVAVLVDLLASRITGSSLPDPGDDSLLRDYSAWRRPDTEATVAWTDGMVGLFSSPLAVTGMARTAGMLAHSLLRPLRRRLAVQAMGYRGRLPRLATGESLEDLLPAVPAPEP